MAFEHEYSDQGSTGGGDATEAKQDTIIAKTNLIPADNATRISTDIPAIKAKTDLVALASVLGALTDAAVTVPDSVSTSINYLKGILTSVGLSGIFQGLVYYGVVDNVPGANQFRIPALAGLGAGKFANVGSALNPYYAYCLRDAAGAGDLPQGQQNPITAYLNTGVFTAPGFAGGGIGVGDEVLIIHNNLSAWQLEIYTDVIALMGRLTVARAGYLDNINQAGLLQITAARAALLDQITALRLAELDAANLPADVDLIKAAIGKTVFGTETEGATDVNGTTWKDLLDKSTLTAHTEIWALKLTTAGTWAGNCKIRITDGAANKLFPFGDEAVENTDFISGVEWAFPAPVVVPLATGYKIQFRSSDAGDGAGETCALTELQKIERG
jgi:hypothetical protein